MSAFLWSPSGNSIDLRGSKKKWSNLTQDCKLSEGTWYYGTLEELPVSILPRDGWVVDCHNVWDHPPTQATLAKHITPLCIVSYVKYNGHLAKTALQNSMATNTPIVLVYQHSHKALILNRIKEDGGRPLGLIDDRWCNLGPVLTAGFTALHCVTALSPDTIEHERTLSAGSGAIFIETQAQLDEWLKFLPTRAPPVPPPAPPTSPRPPKINEFY